MVIRSLRVNHLENPLGFNIDPLVLTWIAEKSSGKRQQAARVQIALDGAFAQTVYDSGLREDISSLGFQPDFALQRRTRYFWRVEVLADDGDRAVSPAAWFETGKGDEPWVGQWIRAPFEEHPELNASFAISGEPVCARLYICGLGLYEASINGAPVTDEVLTPFCNDYANWIQAQTYDVTALLTQGENSVNVILGNGWYKGRFGFSGNQTDIYGSAMQLIAEIRVTLFDGEEIVIGTDTSWNCVRSPIVESSIYDGEVLDARMEGATESVPAIGAEAPQGALQDRLSPPLRIAQRRKCATLLRTPKDEWVLDFGQVMTGWVEFDANAPQDAEILLEYGELLQNDCFYRDNLRSAKARYAFISAGTPEHVRPHFTFYGFRFVKVSGLETVDPEAFTACVIHSELTPTGQIETSNEKVNRLFLNAWWGQLGNFLDVPTDCPQRDERMGWTGDAHVFAPTASYNMYTPAFYAKFLHDMLLEQRALNGSVPFVVPDFINRIVQKTNNFAFPESHGSCAWGDAAVGIPWTLYTFYGDRQLLARQYENMKLWTDWIRAQDDTRCGGKRLWTCGFHFADWLALDNPVAGSSFGGTDPYFIASAYYYNAARTTAKAAGVLGRIEEQAEYDKLADEIRDAFRKEFFTQTGRVAERTQTAMVMALCMDLVPEAHRARVQADLRQKLKDRGDHLDTGFVGTYYLCPTLTQNGMADVAYTLLLNEDYPSWLYEVNMGATTVWERWNSVLPNGLVSDTGMNSMNHYAYGSIVEWMYRYMAGIDPVEDAPGFKRVRIHPSVDGRIQSVKAQYDSASGLYRSEWSVTENGVIYVVEIPFDCEALFEADERYVWTVNGAPARIENGAIALEAGAYAITRTEA
ncbi:MAG: family 78 glycoside hydrolase catalytic domain [Clostridia bacterium]|nr:family 78 glycoside hydrolase catalytic domain [Clostridia bacterium]